MPADEIVEVNPETMVKVEAVADQLPRRRRKGNGTKQATAANANNHTPIYFIMEGQNLQRKGVESTLELAALLKRAHAELDADGYKQVHEALGYSRATASKFRTIADSAILNGAILKERSYRNKLPSHWVTLYYLALAGKENKDALIEMIEEGSAKEMEQKAAIDWLESLKQQSARRPERQQTRTRNGNVGTASNEHNPWSHLDQVDDQVEDQGDSNHLADSLLDDIEGILQPLRSLMSGRSRNLPLSGRWSRTRCKSTSSRLPRVGSMTSPRRTERPLRTRASDHDRPPIAVEQAHGGGTSGSRQ